MGQITIKLSLKELIKEQNDIIINIDDDFSKEKKEKVDVKSIYIFDFMESIINHLTESGNIRTSETYKCTLNSFKRYRKDIDIGIKDINSDIMESYETYLKKNNISLNTISFYMRVLRATYNRAIENGITSNRHPFRNVYTSIGKTVKRAVDIDVIKKLKAMEGLTNDEKYARDMFLFSFYTRGMSFVDMAYLKTTDVTEGILTYKRKKTGQQLSIRWDEQMQEIIEHNLSISNLYLLPIITKNNGKERNQYRYKQYLVNENLKKISNRLGLKRCLTMYVARHSWATIARDLDVPIDVISRGMGHDSEKTTQIYLKTIDGDAVDNANSIIMSALDLQEEPSKR